MSGEASDDGAADRVVDNQLVGSAARARAVEADRDGARGEGFELRSSPASEATSARGRSATGRALSE